MSKNLKYNIWRRKWYSNNKDKAKKTRRKWKLTTKYGVTEKYINNLYIIQNGKCGICGVLISLYESKELLTACVDHNHQTGKVRGLLCANCNTGLGMLKDSVVLLENAKSYLERTD